MAPRFSISPEVTFRIRGERVEATLGQSTLAFSRAFHSVLLSFTDPLTIAEVHRALGVEMPRAQLSKALQPFIERGFLASDTEDHSPTLEKRLNRRVWNEPGFRGRLTQHLKAGSTCIIRNALEPAFAARVADELEETTAWSPDEKFSAFFGYKQHVLSNPGVFPKSLSEVERLFGSPGTKRMMESLCGANCRGTVDISASLYLPGDYSLPHQDNTVGKTLTFLWYLTRRWKSSWGGQLFWCSTGQFLMPTFNTLVMFRTTNRTQHLVCPVAPTATQKRLTVLGWWRTDEANRGVDAAAEEREARSDDWLYGKPLKAISKSAFVIP